LIDHLVGLDPAATRLLLQQLLEKEVGRAERNVGCGVAEQYLGVRGVERAVAAERGDEAKRMTDAVSIAPFGVTAVGQTVARRGVEPSSTGSSG
jgi:hypothetical protein